MRPTLRCCKENAMPMYLHQWRYKPDGVRKMLEEQPEREQEVRAVTEAFGGTLHHFYFCIGEFDGVAVTEYPNDEIALASLMAHYTLGRVDTIRTTPLIGPEGIVSAKKLAREVLGIPPGE
jgi:uncharacterized protein with GYD domain